MPREARTKAPEDATAQAAGEVEEGPPTGKEGLAARVLRQQMLVNEREAEPQTFGGMPKNPIENAPISHQPGGNPPATERARTVEAPPRTEAQIEREEERLQFKGS